jgi:OOP family OmpA-OmpF porin
LIQGVFTSSLAQAQNASPQSVSGSANNTGVFELGNAFVAPGSVDKQQTRLIFYRTSNSSVKGGASIYFDGMYHTTLAPSAYSVLCVTPDRAVNLGVKTVLLGSSVKDNFDSISTLELQGGINQYVRVIEDRRIKVLHPVSEAEALEELAGIREQIHTLSRVKAAKVCPSAVAETPKPSEQVQIITLAADALFSFAGSDRKALGAKGRTALDNLITNIKNDYSIINQLDVSGHTDPIGSEKQNDRLSSQRAQTVKSYLQENGLQSTRITAQGRGASELVVNTCGRAAKAANIACNSPNRRVTVEIRGTRR